ncbi:hypothetical protein O6H91_04G112900 [Diphasiastrum complanatum]|uniref:Uncharacterized protein n=1 Tax=Diphasiastrum complanatum TaxID=34168 RepID=A0ACC2E0W6_DIPCM|nr:hypothetical protein O6H91_04G112900 [Diphasiastrum complanatum]
MWTDMHFNDLSTFPSFRITFPLQMHILLKNRHVLATSKIHYRYALEMQHEFISEVGDIAIIAIFYKYAKNSNPYISQYFKYLPQLKNENVFTNITVPVHLAQEDLYPYYLYKGSLARPPCTEGVTWIIAQNVKLLSQAQVEALKSITKGNSNRPAQPVNGRKVFVPAY